MQRKGKRALALLLTLVMAASLTWGGAMATSAENLDPAVQSQSESGGESGDVQAESKGEMPDTEPAGETVPVTEQSAETPEHSTEAPAAETVEHETETGQGTPSSEETTAAGETATEMETPSSETASETAAETDTEGMTERETAADESDSLEETQKESLVQQTVKASDSGASAVTLSGMMPEGASARAIPVHVEIEGQTILAAYDITIYDRDGKEFQPEQGSIRVEIADAAVQEAVAQAEDISVFHMENAQAAPEAVAGEKVDAAGDTVAFEAESFSIYVVATPETHFTHTYNFYNGETLLGTQILSTGETLQEPASLAAGDHQAFTGWYTQAEGGTQFTAFGQTEGALTENIETNLYARFKTAYYVFYMSEDSSRVIFTQTYITDGAAIVTDPAANYFATDAGKALIGWSVESGASEPDAGLKVDGADMTLYPVIAEARWITYDSQGGTPVDPAYVLTGNTTVAPQAPAKTGYSFSGWYLDADCSQEFTFGSVLNKDIKLYAGWTAAKADYTVVIWKQKVTGEKNAYDYAESHTVESVTGEPATAAGYMNLAYTGFYYDHSDSGLTVAADGSTILNVYYNRQVITLNFGTVSRSNNGVNYNVLKTLTGLYGAPISGWPQIADSSGGYYWWYTDYQYYNDYWGYIGAGTRLTFLDTFMPANISADDQNATVTVNYYGFSVNSDRTIKFYTQNLDGTYTEAKSVNTNGGNFYISDKFTGFKAYGYSKNNSGASNITRVGDLMDSGSGSYFYDADPSKDGCQGVPLNSGDTLYIYFNRNTYAIDYMNRSKKVHSDSYPYETSLEGVSLYSGEDLVYPGSSAEAGWYTFDGWYADPECTAAFTLPESMPANNLVAYAKWVPRSVKVTFDLNYTSEDSETVWTEEITVGSTVEKPEDPAREGYTFAGWLRNGEPFNFSTQITEDTRLTALWISSEQHTITYKAGEGTGNDVTDPGKYAEGSQAKAGSVPDTWEAPEGSAGFLYWIDMDGNVYYPEDTVTIGNADIVLTAIWADTRSTALTYDFNGGIYKDGTGDLSSLTVTIATPNSEYEIEDYAPTKPGCKFMGWTTASDGTGTLLKAGDRIQVDTLEPQTNILYAKWAQIYTVTVRKIVSGNMGDTVSDTSYSFSYSVRESGGETAAGTLAIRHNGSETISDVVSGSTVTIAETSRNEAGYKTYVQVGDGNKEELSSVDITVTGNTTVTFYNEKEIVPPTGLADRFLPAAVMTLFALAGAVCLCIAARRKRKEGYVS